MALNNQQTAYIQIHIAVILFGFTAILGDLIQLPAIVLVWWRVLITSFSLLFFIQFGKNLHKIPKDKIKTFALIGAIVGLHWICFYGSIKLANASISLICMGTTSFFTSILEPIIVKRKIKVLEICMGACVIPGMFLVVQNVNLSYQNGIWVGLAAALLAALFAILNKKHITSSDPYTITFIELTSAWIMLSGLILILQLSSYKTTSFIPPNLSDWIYLILLALLCTTLAFVLSLKALQYISAFASNLVINLEPVYGIILAILILNEHNDLSPMFYLGGAIILLSVLLYPYLNKLIYKKPI